MDIKYLDLFGGIKMSVVEELLSYIDIPRFVKIKQKFIANKIDIDEIPNAVYNQLHKQGILSIIKQGQKIGITAGSRGVANIALIIKEIVKNLKDIGANPYVIPCMGSHGGATALGQREIIESLGITEQYVGAPILSSMEVVKFGETKSGLDVFVDKNVILMDKIILINRIKPHTAFRGTVESGLQKMIAIGMGKQKGAETCHAQGFGYMHKNITEIADIYLKKGNIAFAIGLVENSYDETCIIEAIKKEDIQLREPELLKMAKMNMPRIMIDNIDVLIIDEIGKNISGDGMDPNITGRYPTPYASGGPNISKITILDLTEESHGNGNGIGTADFTTKRLVEKLILENTYPNALTSTVPGPVKIPMYLKNDLLSIKAAIKTCNCDCKDGVRIVRIKNTLSLENIYIFRKHYYL
jgi:hypothetical protein